MDYYASKDQSYYQNLRNDIIPYIAALKNGSLKMLDVGCGTANTLCYLKEQGIISEAWGTELFEFPGSNQANPLINGFQAGDIQQKNLEFPKNYFDVILCADVLEHLSDPWDTLEYLKTFLAPGGSFIISLPNIREYKVIARIVFKGDFRYASSGVMDKTHLRWFCKTNMLELLQGAGFYAASIKPSFLTCPLQKRRKQISRFTLGIFDNFLAQQYIMVGKKSN
jgi:2-polyprenyl-3-methyl-5-hydroxy-6-metoxy-1,4-benzoquinol methylase